VNNTPPLLETREICKSFPGVRALDRVDLRLEAGEVLAVVGENGAGKSTLMKILAGVYQPDRGTILLDGKPVRFADVAGALRLGISLIHQELNLAENLSVSANLFLGRETIWGGPLRLIHRRSLARRARELMDRVGLDCQPETVVEEMSPGQRQLVEIARALSLKARILIMDEPTSSLTQRETERLFQVVADLARAGVAVVYISHRLAEVRHVANRVVVLRDGRNAGELKREQVTHDAMVRLMVGREIKQFYRREHVPAGGEPRLEVRALHYAGGSATTASNGIWFKLHAGEIVGMAGLVGAGRTELAEALFGIRPLLAGQVLLDGRLVRIRHPHEAILAGLVLVPEDRRYHGLILEESIRRNIGLPNLDRLSFLRLIAGRREAALAEEMRARLRIHTPTIAKPAGLLSGGNQQKVVLGKWLARRPKVLILDEPTRGIDVGAKSEIYALMDQLAGEGMAILMISSDLEEILGMSDRVLVMHQGRLAGDVPRNELSEERIMRLATGGRL
jgi:ribose transport system ATP-binding protein